MFNQAWWWSAVVGSGRRFGGWRSLVQIVNNRTRNLDPKTNAAHTAHEMPTILPSPAIVVLEEGGGAV